MKAIVPLRVGVEYQLFTRFGVRKGIWEFPHSYFRYTDCTHPQQQAAVFFDEVYVVDRLTEFLPALQGPA